MIKEYFSDGLLQIAIILSLLRTDLNSFYFPNNVNNLLSYPEVQDILQGQTVAYQPTNFHNQYNTLNSIGGTSHLKHIDNDVYFSSLFRELRALSRFQRFNRVSTNIEAFLVSDTTIGFPPAQTGSGGPDPVSVTGDPSSNINQQNVESISTFGLPDIESQVSNPSDNFSNGVGGILLQTPCDILCQSPFPDCDLTKEDLDLIDVLWRQDVDLGVGKEVFDPNLRRELERERELELIKESNKRKEVEKQRKDRQYQAHQWLTQNFVRDGETGEWVPIAGTSNSFELPSGLQTSASPGQEQKDLFTLDDALEFVDHLTGEGLVSEPEQFEFAASLLSEDSSSPVVVSSEQQQQGGFHADSFNDETEYSDSTNQERLEQNWQELVHLLNQADAAGLTAENEAYENNILTMPPVETSMLPLQTASGSIETPLLTNQNISFWLLQDQHLTPPLNETRVAFHQNDTSSVIASDTPVGSILQNDSSFTEAGNLLGLFSDPAFGFQNSSESTSMENLSADGVVLKSLVTQTTLNAEYNSSIPDQDTISPLDWESGELFFPNITGLASNLTNMASVNSLETSDLLPGFLPDEDLELAINEGLQSIQMLDDAGSDSAISMGSGSPQQEENETVEMSPFDGLEGATGGSSYDSTASYNHCQSHTRTSNGDTEDDSFHYSCSSYGSPASVNSNCSTGSNDTEHSGSFSSTATASSHVHHNHTYPTQPGQTPREVKKYAKKDGSRHKGTTSRDHRRAIELKVPFSFEHIIESSVEEFNDMVTKTKLTQQQISLMRDIRRRGKNKVAAQNCRKRKLDVIFSLEDEMTELQCMRDKLINERRQIDQQTRHAKDKYSNLYDHIFRSLRDDQGHPYNPDEYSLQQSSDGNVFLVPRSYNSVANLAAVRGVSKSNGQTSSSSTSASNTNHEERNTKQKKKNKE